ncbi:DUF4347 domain-containing protein [Verrucomicrobia bacterium]|nr:DUF4347 domain-containing protein [Verrucomicrobiota bacterium]
MPAKKKTAPVRKSPAKPKAKKAPAAGNASPRKKATKARASSARKKAAPKSAPLPEPDPETDFFDGLWEDASEKAQSVADGMKKQWKKAAAQFQKAANSASKTAQEVLDDAYQVANRASVVRKATNVINIVVYDKSETPPPCTFPKKRPTSVGGFKDISPFSLAFWWKTGGDLNQMRGAGDILIGANTWKGGLRKIVQELRKRSEDDPVKIGSLQFWGHGTDGAMLLAGSALDSSAFDEDAEHRKLLDEIRGHLDPRQGSVWFRGCHTFRGKEGQAFAKTAADYFKVPVVGHTYLIWLLQSGTQVLKPGAKPDWTVSQGKGRINDPWSDASRPRTISMLKFHPPTRSLEFISKKNLEKCTSKFMDYTSNLFRRKDSKQAA